MKTCSGLNDTLSMHFPNLRTINCGLSFHMLELGRHNVFWFNLVVCNRTLPISHFCTLLFGILICNRHMTLSQLSTTQTKGITLPSVSAGLAPFLIYFP